MRTEISWKGEQFGEFGPFCQIPSAIARET